jgi:hypothetical protein
MPLPLGHSRMHAALAQQNGHCSSLSSQLSRLVCLEMAQQPGICSTCSEEGARHCLCHAQGHFFFSLRGSSSLASLALCLPDPRTPS